MFDASQEKVNDMVMLVWQQHKQICIYLGKELFMLLLMTIKESLQCDHKHILYWSLLNIFQGTTLTKDSKVLIVNVKKW